MAKRLYKLGSLAQDTRTGLKTIFKLGLVGKYNTLEAPQDTDYQVPADAVFYFTRIACIGDAANTVIQFLYGDPPQSLCVLPEQQTQKATALLDLRQVFRLRQVLSLKRQLH